jgi:type III secretory pathway lipoprotein EscJ
MAGGGIFETREQTKLRRDLVLAAELADSLETMTGVVKVRVHLTTPPRESLFNRKTKDKGGAAVMVVRDNDQTPTETDVRSFVAAAVPGLSPETIAVFVNTQKAPAINTVFIGPVEVAESSAHRARVLVGFLLGLTLIASGGLVFAGIRLWRIKKK